MMKKVIPLAYTIFLYLFVFCLFYLQIDVGPFVFLSGIFILGIANIWNACRLNKEKDEEDLKFSMIVTTFGNLPFYIMVVMFFGIVTILASDIDNGAVTSILMLIWFNGFIRISCAFYPYFYIRLKGYPKIHRYLAFVPFVNAIDMIYLLIRYREKKN